MLYYSKVYTQYYTKRNAIKYPQKSKCIEKLTHSII